MIQCYLGKVRISPTQAAEVPQGGMVILFPIGCRIFDIHMVKEGQVWGSLHRPGINFGNLKRAYYEDWRKNITAEVMKGLEAR